MVEGLVVITILVDNIWSEKQMGAEFHRIARFWVPTVYHALDSEVSKTQLCFKRVWTSVKAKDNKHIHYNTLETAGLRERREGGAPLGRFSRCL